MTNFSEMDPNDICRWLDNRNVLTRVGQDLYKTYHGDYILCVCAFAARDYLASKNLAVDWDEAFQEVQEFPWHHTPVDWLIAAATVIEKQES
jgi:hypothetical protein